MFLTALFIISNPGLKSRGWDFNRQPPGICRFNKNLLADILKVEMHWPTESNSSKACITACRPYLYSLALPASLTSSLTIPAQPCAAPPTPAAPCNRNDLSFPKHLAPTAGLLAHPSVPPPVANCPWLSTSSSGTYHSPVLLKQRLQCSPGDTWQICRYF